MTGEPSSGTFLLAPLRVEAYALGRGAHGATVVRTGRGPRRARAAPRAPEAAALVVAGFGGAVAAGITPGALVVATEVIGENGERIVCTEPEALCAELERSGLDARTGPIVSSTSIVRGERRRSLARMGALAVDQESLWLAPVAAGRPFAVVRAIVDTPERELYDIFATIAGGLTAYRTLVRASPVLAAWHPVTLAESDSLNEEPCPSPSGKARA